MNFGIILLRLTAFGVSEALSVSTTPASTGTEQISHLTGAHQLQSTAAAVLGGHPIILACQDVGATTETGLHHQ